MLKNGLIVVCMLILGTACAQETEMKAPPPPVPRAPAPPVLDPNAETQEVIFDFPDVDAEFPGNAIAMKKFIQDNVVYPMDAREKNIQGRVYVTFIVERDGSITGVDIMRGGVSPSINREAKRLVSAMPNWTPGEFGGSKVRTRCRLPITFTLTNSGKKEVPE